MNSTVQVTIDVKDNDSREQLIALLSLMNFDAFEETETSLLAFVDEKSFSALDIAPILEPFNLNYSTTVIPPQNWNAVWESNFEPVIIDDFCAIRADFHKPITHTKYEIVITPKMSFGTGHHATTYLMLQQMQRIDFKNKSVADFGTGTGILGIMAERLGADSIVAIDYDDVCIENTNENICQNNCSKISVIKKADFDVAVQFDIILANINKNVILNNLNHLKSNLSHGGKLLLSGLLKSDEQEIVSAFEANGMKWKRSSERNNWISVLLEV